MGRALKWIGIAVLGLVVLLALAVGILVAVVDPNDYRDDIAREVERRTGRALSIDGDIELSFWPTLGLKLGATRLADAPGFGSEPFLALEQARLGVGVWPLISERRVVLDRIVLDGLSLRLIRDAQGRANWEQLLERLSGDQTPAADEPEPAPEREPGGGRPPVALESIGGVELSRVRLLYEDRQAGQSVLLDPLNVRLSELRPGARMPLAADWVMQAEGQPRITGSLSGELVYSPADQRLEIPGLTLKLLASGEQLPGGELPLELTGSLQADLRQGRYSAPDLTVQAAGMAVKASVEARQQAEGVSAEGRLSVPGFSPRELMRRLGMEAPQTADAKALSSLSAEADFRYAGSSLALPRLALQLDDSRLAGKASVPSFSPLAADFELDVDQIDLDRYLPPPSEEKPKQPSSDGEGTGQETGAELPMEALRELDLDGVLRIGRLIVRGMTVTDVTAELHAADGRIRLAPLNAQLYEGRYQGQMELDARGAEPRLSLEQRLAAIQAGPLLQDLIGAARLTGLGDLALTADMAGPDVDAWLSSLNGKASFKFSDGAVAGVNVAALIRQAQARLKGQAALEDTGPQKTDFSVLAGTLTIEDGVARNRDLELMSPLMRVTGEGKVDLARQSVDYLLTVNLVSTLEGQGGRELAELSRIPIPIRIGGGFDGLDFRVDLVEALRQSQGARIEAEREKAEAKVREKVEEESERLREKASDALQRLFERDRDSRREKK